MKKILLYLAAASCCLACDDAIRPEPELPAEEPVSCWTMPFPDGDVETYAAPEPPFEYSVEYQYDKSDFCNPERGSYLLLEYHFRGGNIPEVMPVSKLAATRKNKCTLHLLNVYLCDYLESDIPEAALQVLRQHFENERIAGTKVVLRHAYSWDDKWPVQDPELKWVLRHIEQLAPVWNEYQDVIYVVQAGFVGTYGEWHSSTHLSSNEARSEIVKALLDNVPQSRQVALRTPGWKRITLANITGKKYELGDTIKASTAFDGSYNSRLAGHNDCVLATSSDGGTFSSQLDTRMWEREGHYTSMGGESCFMGDYACMGCRYSNAHLRAFHFSYLCNVYQVADVWRDGGCHDDLTRRVGYRLVFNGAAFYGRFRAGGDFLMKLCLSNYGFASIINERKLELILVSDSDPSEKYVFVTEKDPRDWKCCRHYEYDEKIVLPEGLKPGQKYTLYMNLPDISPNLHDNPEYSIRIASKGVWDEATGYNRIASFMAEK